jgi:hypothetical protein
MTFSVIIISQNELFLNHFKNEKKIIFLTNIKSILGRSDSKGGRGIGDVGVWSYSACLIIHNHLVSISSSPYHKTFYARQQFRIEIS